MLGQRSVTAFFREVEGALLDLSPNSYLVAKPDKFVGFIILF
jgi:hypothetical protein